MLSAVPGRISNAGKTVAWIVFCVAVLVSIYGIYANGLLKQGIWTSAGLRRLELLAILYAIWSGVFLAIAPRWFGPLTISVLSMLAAVAVGPIAVLAVLFFLFSCFVTGALLMPDRGTPSVTSILLELLLGVSVWMAILGLMVHFPINYGAVYVLMLVVPLGVKPKFTVSCLNLSARLLYPRTLGRSDYYLLALAGFPVLCNFLVTLEPETGTDALAMHLMAPAWIAFQHQWSFDFRHIAWAVMPLGADWCYAAVYLLGGEFAARLLNFSFFVTLTVFVGVVCQRYAGRGPAFLLAGLLASTPLTLLVTGSLFVENLWAILLFGAVIALEHFHERSQPRLLYLSGVLLGAGLATKFITAAFLIPAMAFGIWELVKCRKLLRHPLRVAATAACLLVVFGAPPYAFAYVKTGNPIFPFMNHIFKSPWFDTNTPFIDVRYTLPLDLLTPYHIVFQTHKYLESHDGALGFQYMLFVALGFVAFSRRWPYLGLIALGISLAFCFVTFSTIAYIRYWYPVLPLLTVVGAVALGRLHAACPALSHSIRAVLLLALILNVYFFPSSGWSHGHFFVNPFHKHAIEEHATEATPVRNLKTYLNRMHPGEPVAFFGTEDIAGLRAKAYVLGWHNERYQQKALRISSPAAYGRLAQSLGLKRFVAPVGWSRTGSNAPIAAFLARYTDPEYSSGSFEVRRLKPEAALKWTQEDTQITLAPCPPGMIDDHASQLKYSGQWYRVKEFGDACNGTLTFTDAPRAEVTLRFTGKAVTYFFTKAFSRGMAEVIIDGAKHDLVDLYSPGIEWRSNITYGGLTAGAHSLTIRVLHEKAADSQSYHVDIDGFLVR